MQEQDKLPDTQPGESVPIVIEQPPVLQPAKKSKKSLFVIAGVALLVFGGAAAYLLTREDAEQPVQASLTADQTISINAENSLFFQANTKIQGFDTKSQETKTVTEKIPSGATVIDFFMGTDGWRLYYQQIIDSKDSKVFYLESGQEAKEIVAVKNGYITSDASAKDKLLVYSVYPGTENEKSQTTRTYKVKDNSQPELIYESDALSDKTSEDIKNLKNPLYHMDYDNSLAPDNSKLLFALSNCYNCDGGDKGYYAELNLSTNKMTALPTGSKAPYRTLAYDGESSTSYILKEYDSQDYYGSLGEYAGFQLRLSRFTNPADPKLVFSEKNKDWILNPSFSPDLSLLAANYYKNPGDWESATLKSIYEVKGTTTAQLVPLPLKAPEKVILRGITNMKNDCLIASAEKQSSTDDNMISAASVCKDGKTYSYKTLTEFASSDGDNYLSIKLL